MKSLRYAICLFALAAVAASCGYRLVGTGGQFPAGVEQVAVHIFENRTKDTDIARLMTDHFIRELQASGRVRVVSSEEAQAEIKGVMTKYEIQPITFDADRKVTENRLALVVDVSLSLMGSTNPTFLEKGVTRYYEYPVQGSLAEQEKEKERAEEAAAKELSQKIITLMTEGF